MTFKRPTSAGWAVLAIGALCAVGFVDAALAQTAAPAAAPAADAAARRGRGRCRSPTRAIPPGCSYPARSF